MEKSNRRIPFMPFYVSDFRGNPDVRAMTFTERMIYLEILMDCWEASDDSVADDPVRLARAIGISHDEFLSAWVAVRDRLVESRPGRLTHPRIGREKAKVIEKSDKMRDKMKKYWTDKKAKEANE